MHNDDRLCSSNHYKPCWKIKQVSLHTRKRINIIYSTVTSYACKNIQHSTVTSYIVFVTFRTFFSELSEKKFWTVLYSNVTSYMYIYIYILYSSMTSYICMNILYSSMTPYMCINILHSVTSYICINILHSNLTSYICIHILNSNVTSYNYYT